MLSFVPASRNGGDFAKPVAIGAIATTTTRTYCYLDGPRGVSGDCISINGTAIAGQYSDFGFGVPTSPTTQPVVVLLPLSYSAGRWAASALSAVTQVACQFAMCSQYCMPGNTWASSGNFPLCRCTCMRGWDGPRCQRNKTATVSQSATVQITGTRTHFGTHTYSETTTNGVDSVSRRRGTNSAPATNSLTMYITNSATLRRSVSRTCWGTTSISSTILQSDVTHQRVSTWTSSPSMLISETGSKSLAAVNTMTQLVSVPFRPSSRSIVFIITDCLRRVGICFPTVSRVLGRGREHASCVIIFGNGGI